MHEADTELKKSVKQSIVIRKDAGLSKLGFIICGVQSSIYGLFSLSRKNEASRFYVIPKLSILDKTGDLPGINVEFVKTESELFKRHADARGTSELISDVIVDNGLTEFGGTPTPTAFATLTGECEQSNRSISVVLRDDLNMRKGKLVSQAAHAVMSALISCGHVSDQPEEEHFSIPLTEDIDAWLMGNFRKIVLGSKNMDELDSGVTEAAMAQVPTYVFKDTNGTTLGAAFGPTYANLIDLATKQFSLL